MRLPGDEIAITSGAHHLVATTIGATLREYTVRGKPVLDGFSADEVCPGARGQVLMPWPNRIADGRYEIPGGVQQLPIDDMLGHAIHGLVRWTEWRVEYQAADSVRFRHALRAQPGYPFQLDLAVEYRLSQAGLAVTFRATNIGAAPCPFGAGAHPYFTFGTRIDEVEMRLPAESWLEADERAIPRKRRPVEGSELDFRSRRAIGATRFDHAFVHLERDRHGVARVHLRHGADELDVWFDRSFDFVQVYTGDTLGDRGRQSVAVEPMTCAPNAFNSKDGLRMLAPGEMFEGRWGVEIS